MENVRGRPVRPLNDLNFKQVWGKFTAQPYVATRKKTTTVGLNTKCSVPNVSRVKLNLLQ